MSSMSRIASALERIAAALEKSDQYESISDGSRARAAELSEQIERRVTGR